MLTRQAKTARIRPADSIVTAEQGVTLRRHRDRAHAATDTAADFSPDCEQAARASAARGLARRRIPRCRRPSATRQLGCPPQAVIRLVGAVLAEGGERYRSCGISLRRG